MAGEINPETLIAFLRGEGELEGRSFGDRDDKGHAFWWRKYLPALALSPPMTATAELVGRLRAIDEEAMYNAPATTYATVQEAAASIETIAAALAEAEARQRWNIEETDAGLVICRGDHERAERCDEECFVSLSRATAAEAERDELQATVSRVQEVVDQGYPAPPNKVDTCHHGKFGWEDCIACYDEELTKALSRDGGGDGAS